MTMPSILSKTKWANRKRRVPSVLQMENLQFLCQRSKILKRKHRKRWVIFLPSRAHASPEIHLPLAGITLILLKCACHDEKKKGGQGVPCRMPLITVETVYTCAVPMHRRSMRIQLPSQPCMPTWNKKFQFTLLYALEKSSFKAMPHLLLLRLPFFTPFKISV